MSALSAGQVARLLLVAIVCLSTSASCLATGRLLGIGPFYRSSNLIELSTSSGAFHYVGNTGHNGWIGLTSARNGTVYSILATSVGSPRTLYSIDTISAAPTPLFSLGTTDLLPEGDLAIDTANTSIYVVSSRQLFRIDIAAQTFMSLGSLTYNGSSLPDFTNIDGLAFRGQTLYGLLTEGFTGQPSLNDHLVTIDTSTLAISDVGPLGTNIGTVAGLAYDHFSDVFYATGEGNHRLHSVDPATGHATSIAFHGLQAISGLTYVVPEPTSLVFVAIVALLIPSLRRTGLKTDSSRF